MPMLKLEKNEEQNSIQFEVDCSFDKTKLTLFVNCDYQLMMTGFNHNPNPTFWFEEFEIHQFSIEACMLLDENSVAVHDLNELDCVEKAIRREFELSV